MIGRKIKPLKMNKMEKAIGGVFFFFFDRNTELFIKLRNEKEIHPENTHSQLD